MWKSLWDEFSTQASSKSGNFFLSIFKRKKSASTLKYISYTYIFLHYRFMKGKNITSANFAKKPLANQMTYEDILNGFMKGKKITYVIPVERHLVNCLH